MSAKRFAFAALLVGATFLTTVSVEARTLRWARSQDATTLDPHSGNTGTNHVMAHNIYEPLVIRGFDGKLVGALATEWRLLPNDPTIWEFKLRQGVKFHNGNAFTADDVVFSLKRSLQPAADMKSLLVSVEDVIKVDDHTVHIKTKGPNPLLVNNLTNLMIMDREWSEQNNAAQVQDLKSKVENFATRNANGTGLFQLVSRRAPLVLRTARSAARHRLFLPPLAPCATSSPATNDRVATCPEMRLVARCVESSENS